MIEILLEWIRAVRVLDLLQLIQKGIEALFLRKKGLNHQKLQCKIFANVQISATNLVKGFELAHVDE